MSALEVLRGRLVTPTGVLEDGYVAVAGDRIADIGPASAYSGELPGATGTVLPGLVDIHCHGGGGASFTLGDAAQVSTAAAHHLAQGTTSVVASAVTDGPAVMVAAVQAAAAAVEAGEVAAIHLEGPFLAAERRGAQDPRHLRAPDLGLTRELIEAGSGHVRVMTVAPELPGADLVIELLADHDVVAAVGHTEADVATTRWALTSHGTGLATHLFNGMPPMHHRDPGPVAGALSAAARGVARVELIADGVHLADETVRTVFDLVGASAVVLVTDAMAAAGMPDGDYQLGPQHVSVVEGVARLRRRPDEEQPSIAGGTARLVDVVRRCVHGAGIPLADAVTAASATPAAVLGLDRELGALRTGLRADLLVVDDDLRPLRVMRAGRWTR
ncbi:MAG TPA: N-acetylglucosamine-6-phosphate deacetylase [Nocardioidaceae bacterium]|nr:N-acetylglucosamine-6-phosphate deacetylase [Nocardioidaceae bacterium]